MMFQPPFFHFPSYPNYHYPMTRRSPSFYPKVTPKTTMPKKQNTNFPVTNEENLEIQSQNQESEKKQERGLNDEPWFDLFGIQLYFDDILIICLLFFLYTEGVQDTGLFLCLVMLLLS